MSGFPALTHLTVFGRKKISNNQIIKKGEKNNRNANVYD